jgi:hypothetical protein
MLPIYTITTIPYDYPFKDSRCVGFLGSCHDAFQQVRNNAGDIYEDGHYRYVVIEEVKEGIYTFPREEHWFEWIKNRDDGDVFSPGYIILDKKPNRFNNVVCFSMG